MEENKVYTPQEASNITDLNRELIRKYCDYFNIITNWTQPDSKGHRRFTKSNIEELLEIKKLIQEDRMSWENVRSYRNGEVDAFVPTEQKIKLEEKIDTLLENQKKQDEFNQNLLERLTEITKKMNESEETRLLLEKRLLERTEVVLKLENKLENEIDKSNSWFSKIFKRA